MKSKDREREIDASSFDPMQEPVRPRLLAVRQSLSPRANLIAGLLAFALPFAIWCALSYLPFLWHPLVLVTDAGDTSVVEAAPAPIGASLWAGRIAPGARGATLSAPATDDTLAVVPTLIVDACATWDVEPWDLALTFGTRS